MLLYKDNCRYFLFQKILHLIRIFVFVHVFQFAFVSNAQAIKDELDTALNMFASLNCQQQGSMNFFRSEFSHTCIPSSYSTYAVASMTTGGLYAAVLLALSINNEDLFPGSCSRENRAKPPPNSSISFALCNNGLFQIYRLKYKAETMLELVKTPFTGENPWPKIKDIWKVKANDANHSLDTFTGFESIDYYVIFRDKKPGDWGLMPDLPPIYWHIVQDKDKICVATPGISNVSSGFLTPVGCKFISEPHPVAKYASFMDDSLAENSSSNADLAMTRCSSPGGCFHRASKYSKSTLTITAPIIECIREMAVRFLISKDACSVDDITRLRGSINRTTSTLYMFQLNMRKTVTALLTIYVALYGFKIMLSGESPPKSEWINFIIKIIFVAYFATGLKISEFNDIRADGILDWVLPLLLGGINQIASWISNSGSSNLCIFTASDYPRHLEHLALWDSLDCKLAHYLGIDGLQTAIVENVARLNPDNPQKFDGLNFPIPPWVYILIPAAYSGSITAIQMAIAYPIMVIGVVGYMLNIAAVCIICIVILCTLAPIFVPMLLFQYTKGYFEAWVKLLLSFMLQPMVAVAAITVMFSIYDVGFYGACKYISEPVTVGNRTVKVFYINNDWDDRNRYSPEEAKSCQNSLGFMLNNPFADAVNIVKGAVRSVKASLSEDDYKKKFSFLSSSETEEGSFFSFPTLKFDKIAHFIMQLLTCCILLYLIYHFAGELQAFSSDMTEGINLSAITMNAQSPVKAMNQGASMIKDAKAGKEQDKDRMDDEGEPDDSITGGDDDGSARDNIVSK